MYSKDEASQLKQAFWTTFGQYIAPHLSAGGTKVNWVNYKTGIRHLFFKMHADKRGAYIAIEISHPDSGIQELVFEQFQAFKRLMEAQMGETWDWNLHMTNEHGKTISQISKQLDGLSIFKREDWPALISFFKPRIIALDEFWTDAQYSFDVFK
ncbi:MAG: DUF4268 domain-containing protein [Bacteroidota bacterium]